MFSKKQIKLSKKFGDDYVEKVIEFLELYFTVSFDGVNEVEMDLIYFNYIIDGKKITFISEGMVGTFIIGNSSLIKRIIRIIENYNPELFDNSG